MDRFIAIEFKLTIISEDDNERAYEILKKHNIEIVDYYCTNGGRGNFECRTNSRELFYAVMDELSDAEIDFSVHE